MTKSSKMILTRKDFRSAVTPLVQALTCAQVVSQEHIELAPIIHSYVKMKYNKRTWRWPEDEVMEEEINKLLPPHAEACLTGGDGDNLYFPAFSIIYAIQGKHRGW